MKQGAGPRPAPCGTKSFQENMAFWRNKISFWAILEVRGLISSFPSASAVELKSICEDLE